MLSRSWTHLPVTPMPLTKMYSRAFIMEFRSRSLSSRVFLLRALSNLVPVSGICPFWTRQRGHGQFDRYLMHAMRTLYISYQLNSFGVWLHLLFRVVCCICKDSRKNSTRHPITADDKGSAFICIHEFVIKQQMPYLLHEIYLEESQYFSRC